MYIVEGNIGAGKSTFITLLHSYLPHITYSLEPVDTWATQTYGKSLLEQFYTDPQRWAYTLETLAMLCRSRDYLGTHDRSPYHIMERSLYSGHYCFALNGKEEGYFSPVEWDVYQQWVNFIFANKSVVPRGFIYLQTTPETCLTRIGKRSRNGESSIPLSYLEKIHHWHEQFLIHKANVTADISDVPVLILDVTKDFANNPARMAELAGLVADFMQKNLLSAKVEKYILTCRAN
ncbi:MAG: hypothetical protein QG604_824 [Candidatus Dependentiae bacterium]|nr:hypothetical protein [Candidatus Dependentiae bacterium]